MEGSEEKAGLWGSPAGLNNAGKMRWATPCHGFLKPREIGGLACGVVGQRGEGESGQDFGLSAPEVTRSRQMWADVARFTCCQGSLPCSPWISLILSDEARHSTEIRNPCIRLFSQLLRRSSARTSLALVSRNESKEGETRIVERFNSLADDSIIKLSERSIAISPFRGTFVPLDGETNSRYRKNY